MEYQGVYLLLIWTSIQAIASQTSSEYYQNTTNLMDALLKGYDKRLRPYHMQKAAEVQIDLSIVSIGEVKEIQMDYSMDIFFRQSWRDPRLAHDNVEPLLLKDSEKFRIWLPDTFFQNAKTAKFFNVPSDNSRVVIDNNGNVLYGSRIAVTASCEMDLRRYPLDTQNCNLDILSFSYSKQNVIYKWQSKNVPLDVINKQMAEYQLLKTWKSSFNVHYEYAGTYTHLLAHLQFKRRIEYSLIQIYGPTCLIVILSWMSFWIPHSAVPARVALGITTLLTIVTLLSSIRSSVPKVSYVKAVDWYLIPSFMFVFGSILEYVFALIHTRNKQLQKNREDNNKSDIEIRNGNSQDYAPQNGTGHIELTLLNDHDAEPMITTTKYVGKPYSSQTVSRRDKILKSFVEATSSMRDEDTSTESEASQTDIIDRLARILFPLAYLLFNLVYITIYSTE